MELDCQFSLNAQDYGKFSRLIQDYLNREEKTKTLYNRFPTNENLAQQAQEKLNHYKHRTVLCDALDRQLGYLELTDKQQENLIRLKSDRCLTITTGHQLNLFTGPLYFFYKIAQTIRACEEMNAKHPEFQFVPIYWMATEDHDFEEINHFYYQNKKYEWSTSQKGAVGRMNLEGIEQTFTEFLSELPDSNRKEELKKAIESSYLNSKTLTEATQKLVQIFFGEYGLLMVDGDDEELKKLMIPTFQEDLIENTAYRVVSETNQQLESAQYKLQIHPREINLFYLTDHFRERIVLLNGVYHVLNQDLKFSEEEILAELNQHPERFSPNVILRPFYQETILPNIAYIGGSGEMAYWLQLKSFFESQNQLFPVLIVRNSLLVLNSKQKSTLEKLGIDYRDLLLSKSLLVNQNIETHSENPVDFTPYQLQLKQIFDELKEKAQLTDSSFDKMVEAQRKKQLSGLEKMQKRWIKAEKRRNSNRVERIQSIYDEIYPLGILQERQVNFSEIYMEFGSTWLAEISEDIRPIDFNFTIRTLG